MLVRIICLTMALISLHGWASPCTGKEYKSFDFWLGEWKVKSAENQFATSKISKILDGCVILEEYKTATGFAGKSLNTYSPALGVWHQTWMDNQGGMLKLEGGVENGKMTLRGETLEKNGRVKKHEITWQKQHGDNVQQIWRAQVGKEKWVILFSGIYSKR
ncbi:hypothetical protein L1286_14485 [Pseudoalteromonas sp. SMS1]|uniref:hypothetical protein n=1 Tax=Pseudoalteromonas sp. SMS1 TaxID=2908894 RepID=UPI001F295A82|nr:hypothetical protein [Pseudoalteromonas sp. SMS1]MCF2858691.1 hypothetical protein [Pseudoalteromonas sp. SMS1]